jgi:hypothetical protein
VLLIGDASVSRQRASSDGELRITKTALDSMSSLEKSPRNIERLLTLPLDAATGRVTFTRS